MTSEPKNAFNEAADALASVRRLVLDGERIQTALKENNRQFSQSLEREEKVIQKAEAALLDAGNRADALRSEVITMRSEVGTTRMELEARIEGVGGDLEEGIKALAARSARHFWILFVAVVVVGATIALLVFNSKS